MGRWIEARVPADVRVLSSDLGAIAYCARSHAFVDPTGLTSRAPLAAALANDWPSVWSWLDRARPGLLADTRWPTGEIAAQHILEHPEMFFRGVHAPPDRARTLMLHELPGAPGDARTPDGFQFVIRAVSW